MTILRAAPQHRSDAREAEGGALLRRYTGLNRYRGFESLSLRQSPLQSVRSAVGQKRTFGQPYIPPVNSNPAAFHLLRASGAERDLTNCVAASEALVSAA